MDTELQATTRQNVLERVRDALLGRAIASPSDPRLRMMPPPANFNQPQPALLGVGDPLKLKLAPGLYTSGQGNGLDLPMAPVHLRR